MDLSVFLSVLYAKRNWCVDTKLISLYRKRESVGLFVIEQQLHLLLCRPYFLAASPLWFNGCQQYVCSKETLCKRCVSLSVCPPQWTKCAYSFRGHSQFLLPFSSFFRSLSRSSSSAPKLNRRKRREKKRRKREKKERIKGPWVNLKSWACLMNEGTWRSL